MNARTIHPRSISLAPLIAAALAMPAAAGAADNAQEVSTAVDQEWITLTGTVASVAGDSFTLNYGDKDIVVEMDDYDWFSENAIEQGESVTVAGRMDNDFFESQKIEASSVYVDLERDSCCAICRLPGGRRPCELAR